MRLKLRICQTIEDRKWTYRIQRRRWYLWFNLPESYPTRGEAREALLLLRSEKEYGGQPWATQVP